QAVSATCMLALPTAIAWLYSNAAAVLTGGPESLVLSSLCHFAVGIHAAVYETESGLEDIRALRVITTFAYWGVGMPVGWWLAFPRAMGAQGMWIGLIAGLGVAAVLLALHFRRLSRLPRA